MMEDDSDAEHESVADSDSMLSVDEPVLVTPRKDSFDIGVHSTSSPPSTLVRPALVRKPVPVCHESMHIEEDLPTLGDSITASCESISDSNFNEWDRDIEMSAGQETEDDVELDITHKAFTLPPIPPRPEKWAAIAPSPIVIPPPAPTLTRISGRGSGLKAKLVDWVKPIRGDQSHHHHQQGQYIPEEDDLALLPVLY
jgi:hypothetical protein